MIYVAGVFKSRADALTARAELSPLGLTAERVTILTPDATAAEIEAAPKIDSEQPGMGKAVGASVGAAAGLAIGEAVGSLLVPGFGPVLAIGLAVGAIGAFTGGVVGGAGERKMTDGLPEDELFVYESALRQGRTVEIVQAADEKEAEAVRGALEDAGAESVDRAREMWWVGLRNVQREDYEKDGGNFAADEKFFRCGFEAAQHSDKRGLSYEECREQLSAKFPEAHASNAFRRGFDRGRAYWETIKRNRGQSTAV